MDNLNREQDGSFEVGATHRETTQPDDAKIEELKEQFPFLYSKFMKRQLAKELEGKDMFGVDVAVSGRDHSNAHKFEMQGKKISSPGRQRKTSI